MTASRTARTAMMFMKPFEARLVESRVFFDGHRWWVVTIFSDSERPDQPIPAEYLKKPAG